MSDDPRVYEPNNARVRPRLVWGGTATALAGIVAAGIGVMALNVWTGVSGAILILIGGVIAWSGGILSDTRRQVHPVRELEEVVHGGVHEGISADSQVVERGANRKARDLAEHTEQLLFRAREHPGPSLRYVGAYGLVMLGAWLLAGQGLLDYPFTVTGQDNALRDVGFAVVFVLCGLALRMSRRHPAVTALSGVGGLILVAAALLTPHDSPVVSGDEVLVGALAVGCAALTTRP